jgi:hypothetical protein
MISASSDQELVLLLEDMIANIRSIDDLFFFFGKTLPDLRETLVTHPTQG